ncbi:FUSC family protein [Jatrophihabitans sp.]|uniref:FUSC family protein n=1 Tax=Jatrophihabitans sp. TaxID=1932789 RepID=UPI0030C69A1A
MEWLRSRDAGLSATRRAARAAIVMPAMFALGSQVIDNGTVATFAAFGSFSMLLLVDFGGTMLQRIAAQVSLIGVGLVMVTLGTLASRSEWLAAAAMLVVGFGVLFAAVISSVLAGATTSILLGFILPVTLPGTVASIPDRVEGWALAGAASLIAITLLWPAPRREPLRAAVAEACARIGDLLHQEVAAARGETDWSTVEPTRRAAGEAVAAMRTRFFATPYRPTGLTTAARTLVRLVDEVIWLSAILDELAPGQHPHVIDPPVCAVKQSAATVLEHAAALLRGDVSTLGDFHTEVAALREALTAMERSVVASVPARELVTSLEPSFRAQEMSFAIAALGANLEATVLAEQRSWWEQLLGHQPEGVGGALASAQQRAGAHLDRHSAALQSSIRGAIGLAAAVLVADYSGVQHSFWIVLGTLSVLRSNALTTGQTAVRGLLGTLAGFIVGGALVEVIGTNTTVLWVLLPVAILFAGLAPAAISFAAGQAGFTVTLLILFNIISPAGWKVGLVRVEDVGIGCVISLVVGVMFWPRGAAAALGDALAEAYQDSAAYLRSAVAVAAARCDSRAPGADDPVAEATRAAAAARRVDDAFRGFLAEKGTKHLPLASVTTMVTGVAGLRLTADAVLSLWNRDGSGAAGDRAAARAELEAYGAEVAGWYEQLARALTGAGPVPERLHHDHVADGRLIEAVRRDLTGSDGAGTAVAVRMIWTGEHLDAARRLQRGLVEPAAAIAARRVRPTIALHPAQQPVAVAG